jgi:hypothetical protein
MISLPAVAVETWGVASDRAADALAGTCVMGVATEMPIRFTS